MEYNVYCDESGTVQEKYMILGGIILPTTQIKTVKKVIKEVKLKHNMENHELHFSKLSNTKKLNLYKDLLINTYFNELHKIHFRCHIFNNTEINHKAYNNEFNNNIHYNTLGFYKQYYYVIRDNFTLVPKTLSSKNIFLDITLDARSDHGSVYNELHAYLSSTKNIQHAKITNIKPMNSKETELLQLADLLIGAVSCEVNNRSRNYKLEFVDFIKDKKNIPSLVEQRFNHSFRVMHFKYGKKNTIL